MYIILLGISCNVYYICNNESCIKKVIKNKILNKVLKRNINEEIYDKIKNI